MNPRVIRDTVVGGET